MSRTEENIAKVHQIVRENHQLTVRSIAEQMNINRVTIRKILTEDLDMSKWSQRSSPKNKSKEELKFAKTFSRGKMTLGLYCQNSYCAKKNCLKILVHTEVNKFKKIIFTTIYSTIY
jgi:predicted transcriptional regulator